MTSMKFCPFKWNIEDGVLVSCSGGGDMNPDLWVRYVADMDTKPITKVLGLNLGTVSMTSTQRKQASETSKRRQFVSVVVTDDRMTRGIITAISWFGANIRSFTWVELNDAVKALEITSVAEARVMTRVTALRHAVETEMLKK